MVGEMFSFGCDIFCFQEVDADHYKSHFLPTFKRRGFDGIYKKRTNDKTDGCAIFYNESQVSVLPTL
jgi:mRNA deadenylase 3'-5' endonuclease subunit Ccr4